MAPPRELMCLYFFLEGIFLSILNKQVTGTQFRWIIRHTVYNFHLTLVRKGVIVYGKDAWPSFAWTLLIVNIFHFLYVCFPIESTSDWMTRWTRQLNNWSTRFEENCLQHLFLNLRFSWQYRDDLDNLLPLFITNLSLWLKHVHPYFVTC